MKVAIDGPAASGKSTTAKIIADELKFIYIDSGAMYRACTLKWLEKTAASKSDADEKILAGIINDLKIEFTDNGKTIFVNGKNLSNEIRSSNVSQNVSYVASFEVVRNALVEKQREFALGNNVIMDGRDIGTVVFPDAEVKIFLNASAETRAQRRMQDLKNLGEEPDFDLLVAEIKERDRLDSQRKIAPLTKAKDAIEISTDDKTLNEVTQAIIPEIKKFIAE
jgi:cytidylate kinase